MKNTIICVSICALMGLLGCRTDRGEIKLIKYEILNASDHKVTILMNDFYDALPITQMLRKETPKGTGTTRSQPTVRRSQFNLRWVEMRIWKRLTQAGIVHKNGAIFSAVLNQTPYATSKQRSTNIPQLV